MLKPSDISRDSLDIADRHVAVNDFKAADQTDCHVADVLQKARQRMHDAGIKLRFIGGIEQFIIELIETADRLFFVVVGLDQQMARIHLFDVTVDLAQKVGMGLEVLLRLLDHEGGDQTGKRNDDQRDQRQLPGDRQHHEQYADDVHHRIENLGDRHRQVIGDIVDIIGDPG